MPAPIKWKSKAILVKPEATYGVDPTAAAANAILAIDVELRPMEGESVSRNLERPFIGGQEEIPVGSYVVLAFTVELAGSGTAGTAPAWGPLLRACGCAEVITAGSKVEYTPITDGQESVGIVFQLTKSKHVILGARGTAVLTFNAKGLPTARVTLTGLFSVPTEAATVQAVDYSAWQDPLVVSSANTQTFTIGALPFVMSQFSLDLGCQVEPRILVGAERILIVDRNEQVATQVEAQPYDVYNPVAITNARTKQAILIQHGTVAGRKVGLSVPIAQQQSPGLTNSQNVAEWALRFKPLPSSAGNDQFKLTVS